MEQMQDMWLKTAINKKWQYSSVKAGDCGKHDLILIRESPTRIND